MPELLVELVSEPLPGWAQREGFASFSANLSHELERAGLLVPGVHHHKQFQTFVTPIRLAVHVKEIRSGVPERFEERRGPREGAPDSALAGFMRSVGVDSKDALELRLPKDLRGRVRYWFANVRTPPVLARDLLPGVVAAAMQKFSWRKTMRWEENRFRWPRPLRRCLVLLDDKAVSMEKVDAPLPKGLVSGAAESVDAHGDPFPVASVDGWIARLGARGAFPDPKERFERIWEEYEAAKVKGGVPLDIMSFAGQALQVQAYVAEAPVPIIAGVPNEGVLREFPEEFVSEVVVRELGSSFWPEEESAEQRRFFLIAERPPGGGPSKEWQDGVRRAAERVARARLADADFHWQRDKETGIDALLEKTKDIQFHPKLGSVYDRAKRLEELSRFVAERIGFNAKAAALAGRYAKADLSSSLVQEIPTLESYVGGRLFHLDQAHPDSEVRWIHPDSLGVGGAIARHKRAPEYAHLEDDGAPTLPLYIADRADALAGLWAAGERASGSGDPFALRRNALHLLQALSLPACQDISLHEVLREAMRYHRALFIDPQEGAAASLASYPKMEAESDRLAKFIFKRLEHSLQYEGKDVPYDVVRAVVFCPRYEEGVVYRMREAALTLNDLLHEDAGKDLLVAWGRAGGFLDLTRINQEEFYGSGDPEIHIPPDLEKRAYRPPDDLAEGPEKNLHEALSAVKRKVAQQTSLEEQIRTLASLRGPMDDFLDNVRVLDGSEEEQANRKALLARFAYEVWRVADLGQLEGGDRGDE